MHLGVLLIPGLFVLVSREGEILNDSPGEFVKTALQNEAMSFRPDVPSQRIVFEVPVSFVRKRTRVFFVIVRWCSLGSDI